MKALRTRWPAVSCFLSVALLAASVNAVPVEIVYGNAAGEGFFDSGLGAPRRAAFEFAVDQWGRALAGDVPIVFDAAMLPLGGDGGNALLASSGTVTVHRNFAGARPGTWYPAALANQLARADVNGNDLAEILITFNSDIDGPEVLGSIAWYYGLDAQAGAGIDFVTIALHEIGHGLGFFESVDPASGSWRNGGDPGIFDRMLFRPGVGGFADMLDAERLSAIVAGRRLLWAGSYVAGAGNGDSAVYAPDPFAPGSSTGHWDTGFTPDQLMEPFYTGPNHDPGLLLPALVDMGWQLSAPGLTPGPREATPTPSATPSPSFTPGSGAEFPQIILVTNFDAANVSVIEGTPSRVTATIPVGDGPIGVVVSADGSTAYVASFHAATVSVISTIERRVIDTIPVQGSANGLALTPDGLLLYVTDTFTGTVAVIETVTREVIHTIPAPQQPAGVATGSDGRAFVTNFGASTVSVIDAGLGEVVAKILLDEDEGHGPLSIAFAPDGELGYVTTAYSSELLKIDTIGLFHYAGDHIVSGPAEAVLISPDGSVAYLAATDATSGSGVVNILDLASEQLLRSIAVGDDPQALALSPDGNIIYAAATGSNTLAFFPTAGFPLVGRISVGAAPMGVAIARIAFTPAASPTPTITPTRPPACIGDCDSNQEVTLTELISGVNIALDRLTLNACLSLDADLSQRVTIDELVLSVGNTLTGCP